ncbi:MAG: AhpC/TSA family protein [Flavobacteriaceae bacterium]
MIPKFSLKGKVQGFEDGTVIFMRDGSSDKTIDSTIINNSSFEFKTKISKFPSQVILHNKSFSEYRFVWLENNKMTLDASETNLNKAIVLGSESEILSHNLYIIADTLSRSERKKLEIKFVKDNPSSIVSAKILSVYTTTWGKEKTQELFNKFSIENKNSEYGKSISKYLELNKNPEIGDLYVDFEMKDTNGEVKKLSENLKKITLLEFWASNCGPCRVENPNLIKTYQKYNSQGFEIFAVSQDINESSWLKAIEKDELPWIQVSDLLGRDNLASLIYGINGIPDNFLIDEEGIIIERNIRGEMLNKKLEELISNKGD